MLFGQLVPEKNIFEVFLPYIWAWRPSWSCEPNAANILSSHLLGSTQNLPWIDQAVSEKKIFEIVVDGRKTTNRHRIMAIPLWLTC